MNNIKLALVMLATIICLTGCVTTNQNNSSISSEPTSSEMLLSSDIVPSSEEAKPSSELSSVKTPSSKDEYTVDEWISSKDTSSAAKPLVTSSVPKTSPTPKISSDINVSVSSEVVVKEVPRSEPIASDIPTTDQSAQSYQIFYTRTGERYHYLNPCGRGTYYPCTLDEALQKGLTPCGKCVL